MRNYGNTRKGEHGGDCIVPLVHRARSSESDMELSSFTTPLSCCPQRCPFGWIGFVDTILDTGTRFQLNKYPDQRIGEIVFYITTCELHTNHVVYRDIGIGWIDVVDSILDADIDWEV